MVHFEIEAANLNSSDGPIVTITISAKVIQIIAQKYTYILPRIKISFNRLHMTTFIILWAASEFERNI